VTTIMMARACVLPAVSSSWNLDAIDERSGDDADGSWMDKDDTIDPR
jgi:hypothetical protein